MGGARRLGESVCAVKPSRRASVVVRSAFLAAVLPRGCCARYRVTPVLLKSLRALPMHVGPGGNRGKAGKICYPAQKAAYGDCDTPDLALDCGGTASSTAGQKKQIKFSWRFD